jgi:hypothetical protein
MKLRQVPGRALLSVALLIPAVAAPVGCGSSGEGQIGPAQVGPRPNRGPRVTGKDGQPALAPNTERGQAPSARPRSRQ